jgi:hypothetical protein
MVMVYKAGEKEYDINKIQIIIPEQQTEPSTSPGGQVQQQAPGGSEQEQAEEALEKALGGAPADASKAPGSSTTPAPGAAPDASSGAAPGASQQDEDAKALERAMRAPSSDAAKKEAAPK